MKRFMRNMAAGCLMLATALMSCMDEEWMVERDMPFLTGDEGRMVEVELPFSLSKSMAATVVTRADGEGMEMEDASLSGIHLAIFKDNGGEPENDELILWKLYNRKGDSSGEGSGFWEDTGHGHNTANDGILRFYAPVGKVYIYLLVNAKGTLLDFYKGPDGNYVTDGELINIRNRADFFNIIQPRWKNSLVPTDGVLPMSSMVNNKDGKCLIGIPTTGRAEEGSAKGSIWYQQDGQTEWTEISPDMEDEEHTFMLRRMVSKVTFNIRTPESTDGVAIKFTPRNYTFRHVAQYVPAAPNTIPGGYWPDEVKDIPVVDSETHIFGTQSPNSFTVYLPENMRGHSREREEGKFTYAMRDKVVKDANRQNTFETDGDIPGGSERLDDHKEHYKFQYAPSGSTYVEITGHYEKQSEGKVTESGDTKYIIHLGDFSDKEVLDGGDGYNNFNLARDHHYTYTVTIRGINDIETEVESGDKAEEPNPGVEGIIFKEGAQLRLDAHYETVEMKFNKNAMQVADPAGPDGGGKVPGIYIYTETPFGDMFGTYVFPSGGETQGKFYDQQGVEQNLEDVKPYFKWISFRKQDTKGELAPYYKESDPMSVFEALDAFGKTANSEQDNYIEYYTCFVDEYYYTEDPGNPARTPQTNEFVNKPDRTFSLASDVRYSADGKSGIASAVYVLKQRSIATFYDIDNPSNGIDYIYGLETVDELEGGDLKMETYGGDNNGTGSPERTGIGMGYQNTKEDLEIDSYGSKSGKHVNWGKNGYLLDDDGGAYLPKPAERLIVEGYGEKVEGRYACLTRNRDFDGDGEISGDELRWYTPSLNQVLGIWVGEPGLPASETALYTKDTQSLDPGDEYENSSQYPIFTSSEKNGRVVWGEEGCSFGPNGQAEKVGGRVRAVRTLSAGKANKEDYKEEPQPFYTYDGGTRTFTLHLNNIALRQTAVERELTPHHERDVNVNRPYKTFQVAKRPYVVYETNVEKYFHCDKGYQSSNKTTSYTGYVLQTANATAAKMQQSASILSNYQDPGQTAAEWRLPNQRELALIVMEWDNLKTYYTTDLNQGNKGKGCNVVGTNAECVGSGFGGHVWRNWNESDETNNYLHCRTSFSNSKFFGNHQSEGYFRPYGYLYDIEAGVITMSVGVDAEGTAGYLGVRDVSE